MRIVPDHQRRASFTHLHFRLLSVNEPRRRLVPHTTDRLERLSDWMYVTRMECGVHEGKRFLYFPWLSLQYTFFRFKYNINAVERNVEVIGAER